MNVKPPTPTPNMTPNMTPTMTPYQKQEIIKFGIIKLGILTIAILSGMKIIPTMFITTAASIWGILFLIAILTKLTSPSYYKNVLNEISTKKHFKEDRKIEKKMKHFNWILNTLIAGTCISFGLIIPAIVQAIEGFFTIIINNNLDQIYENYENYENYED